MSTGPPRTISGSAGSRVRVLLGNTGDDFVLVMDEDDGERDWQSYDWSGDIPDKIARQINNCSAKGRRVKQLAFGSNGQWYLYGQRANGTGGHAWWGGEWDADAESYIRDSSGSDLQVSVLSSSSYIFIKGRNGFYTSEVPSWLTARLNKAHRKNLQINRCKCFGSGYFVSDGDGTQWNCEEALSDELKSGGVDPILDVAVASDGMWIVLRPTRFIASRGVSRRLTSRLAEFYAKHSDRQVRQKCLIAQAELDRQAELKRQAELEAKRNREEAERARLLEEAKLAQLKLQAEREAKRKREEAEELVIAQRRKEDFSGIIHAKQIYPGSMVDVVGMSWIMESMHQGRVTRVESDGSVSVKFQTGALIRIPDPRHVVSVDGDRVAPIHVSGSVRMLVEADDKYEASLCLFDCACHHGVCHCNVAQISFDPSPHPCRLLLEHSADSQLAAVPVFDNFKCHEKIDMIRLRRTVAQLRACHANRAKFIEILTKRRNSMRCAVCNKLSYSRNDLFKHLRDSGHMVKADNWLKALNRCQKMQAVAEALLGILKNAPLDKSGCVVHEVVYEHRDVAQHQRLYAVGVTVKVPGEDHHRTTTIQGMPSELRGPLVGAFAHDIDCENSEVRLVCSLAGQLGLMQLIPTIKAYRDQRQLWLDRISRCHRVPNKEAKRLANVILSGGRYKSWLRKVGLTSSQADPELKTFARKLWSEIRALRDQLLTHPRFRWTHIERRKLEADGRHPNTIPDLLIPRIVASCENEVLGIIHRCLFDLGWRVRAKVFDGLIIEPPSPLDWVEPVLRAAEAECKAKDWNIRLCEKPLHGTQDLPLDSLVVESQVVAALMI